MRVAEAPPRDVAVDPSSTPAPPAPRRIVEVALVAGTWLLGQLVFFRSQWFSGFDRAMGDPGAARFIIYVNENWYQSLLGHASWRNPAFYYPLKNTLGLSDTFLLWQLVYTPARALGADPFLAYQLTLVALSALGFATFYALVRVLWRPPIALALVGSVLFAFSNALYVNANHPQLFGVLVLPSVLLLFVAAWRRAPTKPVLAGVLGALAAALFVLVVYSTYYVGFFAILALAIALVLSALVAPRAALERLRSVRDHWSALVGGVLGAIAPGVLFLDTFLPALRASGGYHLASARFFAPTLPDAVNVGTGNLLWGSSLIHAAVTGVAAGPERDYGTTPVLLVCSVAVAVIATVLERRGPKTGPRRYSAAVLAATGALLALAPMTIGSVFVWRAVYWVPGASGIRAIDRVGVAGSACLVLALVDGGARVVPWCTRRWGKPALVGLAVVAAVLCLEQVNVSDSSQLSRRAQLAVLDAVPSPPRSCRAFFIVTTSTSKAHPARTQTTAMLLSERFSLPTLNGTSGSFPKGWHLFFPTSGPTYFGRPGSAVEVWLQARHVTGTVCALDLDTDRWSGGTTGLGG